MQWIRRFASLDDLWSLLGYVFLIVLTRVVNPGLQIALASLLASGMLAVFWLASEAVRTRNSERHPNVRIAIWGAVAVVSLLVAVM